MFRCSGLTSLEVSVAPLLDAFVGFLSQCTQLRTLAIEDLEFWESANDLGLHDSFLPPIVPPAVIPSLRSASFETTTPYHLGVLFRSIILPELEDLTIDLTSYQSGPHFPSLRQDQSQFQSFLLDLLSRSSCQLKKLRFAFLDTPTYKSVGIHWPRMFSASPQLTHLHLMASRWISAVPAGASIDFISALAISDHGLPSLPYLGNIEIDGIINALEYNILRMLESRATFRTSDSDSPPLRAKFRFVKPPSNRPPIPGVMELLKGRNILCDSKFAR
ncbi:hypothetical protein PQX77_007451 [Marasmius sp. AFHP31]|nr:hypothetical protein PQX77_007451 [Marasmius sp. AFHP31]